MFLVRPAGHERAFDLFAGGFAGFVHSQVDIRTGSEV
jgi:hypothetical protein